MEVKPGYMQSEVGIIPEDWNVFQLSDHFRIYAGGDVPKHSVSKSRSETHPYPIFANALQDRGLYGFTGERRAKADSLTITARGYLGHAEYRDEEFFPIVRLLVLEPSGTLDAQFTTFAVNERVEFAFESTGVPQLTAPQVGKYSIAAPPIPEQRAIATALNDVDGLLGWLDRLIAKKRDLKQAAMQQLLTGHTRLPGFHGEWEVNPLANVLVRLNAKAYQIQTSDYQATGKYPVVDQGKEPVIGFSDKEETRLRCPDGGVIVFGDHTCIVKFIDFDFLVGADGTQILQAKTGQSTRFHAFQLQYRGVEPTGYNRHFKFLKERDLLVPTLSEQTAIAKVLADMDAELAALEQRREKTRALKQAMMQELLTGRTRLI